MALFPNKVDIKMTFEGDLAVGGDGDFEITDGFDFLAREINKIVRTINPQWKIHPAIGAGVESYIGRVNTRETSAEMKLDIMDAVERSGLLKEGQSISVDVVPLSRDSVSVYINYQSPGVSTILTKLVVDYQNGLTSEIDDPTLERPTTKTERYPESKNKYLRRIREASE